MLWKRKPKPKPAETAPAGSEFSIPVGRRVYAIGDVHGRDDLFAELIDRIRSDNAARGSAEVTLILLGDLVDRGPQSAEVVERALRLREEFADTRLLVGNHEECFLAALSGSERRLRYFMRIGGDATVRSYWNDDTELAEASFQEVARRLPEKVPQAHIDFLGRGEDLIEIGDYVFVHAGIRHGVPLAKQQTTDLRWIREEFLGGQGDHRVMVIHGHTITDEPAIRPNRIGIDTGAFETGILTAIGLQGRDRWFLDTVR